MRSPDMLFFLPGIEVNGVPLILTPLYKLQTFHELKLSSPPNALKAHHGITLSTTFPAR